MVGTCFSILYPKAGKKSSGYDELWAKEVTGTEQWFCFAEWNTFTAFVTSPL